MAKQEYVLTINLQKKGENAKPNDGAEDTAKPTESGQGGSSANGLAGNGSAFKQFVTKVAKFYSATQFARTLLNNGVSLISTYTGNDRQQQKIQAIIGLSEQTIGTAIGFAINPLVGALSLATQAVSISTEIQKNQVARQVQQLEAAQVRQRAGIFNRSRENGK